MHHITALPKEKAIPSETLILFIYHTLKTWILQYKSAVIDLCYIQTASTQQYLKNKVSNSPNSMIPNSCQSSAMTQALERNLPNFLSWWKQFVHKVKRAIRHRLLYIFELKNAGNTCILQTPELFIKQI